MSERNDGGPAFPREDYKTDCAGGQRGMTLRDYFAAKAMVMLWDNADDWSPTLMRACAKASYDMADAMLKEREGKV